MWAEPIHLLQSQAWERKPIPHDGCSYSFEREAPDHPVRSNGQTIEGPPIMAAKRGLAARSARLSHAAATILLYVGSPAWSVSEPVGHLPTASWQLRSHLPLEMTHLCRPNMVSLRFLVIMVEFCHLSGEVPERVRNHDS